MVPNGRAVSVGDLVVLRDKAWVLGLAWVDEIASGPGKKIQQRCTACSATAIKRRRTRSPAFKCSRCGAEFEEPVTQELDVTVFEADYGRTWRPLTPVVPVKRIRPYFPNNSGQQSIRPMNLEALRTELADDAGLGPTWWQQDGGVRPAPPGGHNLILHKARIGQQQFRQLLLARFGSCCAITGSQPEEALEAAHLYRYAETPHHDPEGGLLLRRDLHTLMDRGLLVIDTSTWQVRLAPRLHKFGNLQALHDQPLTIPDNLLPNADYLDQHHRLSVEAW
ncbi:HNH endonuclease [Actinomadura madurae]|uniref:HNH endonuclease n=2 Tax=Actinomadura madurae TaxID=1993 RepID=A0A1I5S8K6_9ACTN|nr:HNH endonuclease [Actinomadura madurae]